MGKLVKKFDENRGLQYEFLQLKNLYGELMPSWSAWKSFIKNTGLGYDQVCEDIQTQR